MNTIGHIILFFAGMIFGIHWLAALFSWIDLWYDLKRYWPIALRKTLFWSACAGACFWVLPTAYSIAFAIGIIAEGLVYWIYHQSFNRTLNARTPRSEAAEDRPKI